MSGVLTGLSQHLAPGTIVTLFTIDGTRIGAPVYRWTPGMVGAGFLNFGGVPYYSYPVEATGFQKTSKGPTPTPKLRINNVEGYVTGLLVAYGDLVGSVVTRLMTYAEFLDSGATPNPNMHWPAEIWRLDRKASHDSQFVEWDLAAANDQEGIQLPRLQCIRDVCTNTYRVWKPGSGLFDYSGASCPYAGGLFFTKVGVPTADPSLDGCGRRIPDCKLRFGERGVLPMRAFPGMTNGTAG